MPISAFMPGRLGLRATYLAALAALSVHTAAPARETTLAEMHHKTWTARDGAPQGVKALAQGRDGVLWIGGEAGLASFDGRSFTIFGSRAGAHDLPAGPVESILVAKDGSLWVGFRESGVAHIIGGRVTTYNSVDGVELRGVQHIRQASDGAIWALNRQQYLIRYGRDGLWRVQDSPLGEKGGRIRQILIDSSDVLWVAQGGRLYRRPPGETRYIPTEAQADWVFGTAETPDGSIWFTDVITDHPDGPTGRMQRVSATGKVLQRLPYAENTVDALVAPDGSLVVTVWGIGVVRFPGAAGDPAGRASPEIAHDTFARQDGLSSGSVRALLLDKDGNLWVGGQRGIDRFRKARLQPFKAEPSEPFLCAVPSGDVMVYTGGDESRFHRVSGDTTRLVPHSGQVSSMQCGPDGRVWLAATTGIWELRGDRSRLLPPIPGMVPFSIHQVIAAPNGQVFATMAGSPQLSGLWRLENGKWLHVTGGLPHAKTPSTSYADESGRLWLGYRDRLVWLPLGGARPQTIDSKGLGAIYAFLETTEGLLVGGLNGLAAVRDGRLQRLTLSSQVPVQGVAGLVQATNGDLWLNTLRGVLRVRREDFRAAIRNPQIAARADRVAEGDFVGPANLWTGKPSVGRDAQGRLWFATLNGVFHLDPRQLTTGIQPPTLSIRSVLADQDAVQPGGEIAPGVRTLEIQYLGVNLTTPENVVYRYRLEGLEDGWQDAGHRTEAVYARLRPGTYTFRVAASNGNGDWSSTAAFTFRILPHFYQTTWFLAICVASACLLLWLAVSLRLRVVTREIRARAEERADERVRISRDLHDTLLQGVQGLLLTIHVAAQKIPPQNEARTLLDRALAAADRIILEGRNRVKDLRSGQVTDGELAAALESLGDGLQGQRDAILRVRRDGRDTPLRAGVADAVFHIAREAVTNAFRHSGAATIEVRLNYGRRRFQLSCRDDGRGLSPGATNKTGHWGLKGMRERALELGGRLTVQSPEGEGVEIVLTVPARRAYVRPARWRFFWRARTPPD